MPEKNGNTHTTYAWQVFIYYFNEGCGILRQTKERILQAGLWELHVNIQSL